MWCRFSVLCCPCLHFLLDLLIPHSIHPSIPAFLFLISPPNPLCPPLIPLSLPASCSRPQSEAEQDPCGLAQRGRGLPLQRRHHLQDRTHRHPETGLLQRSGVARSLAVTQSLVCSRSHSFILIFSYSLTLTQFRSQITTRHLAT